MSDKAKQDAVVAAVDQNDWLSMSESSRRLLAPIIAGCVLFHRSYPLERLPRPHPGSEIDGVD